MAEKSNIPCACGMINLKTSYHCQLCYRNIYPCPNLPYGCKNDKCIHSHCPMRYIEHHPDHLFCTGEGCRGRVARVEDKLCYECQFRDSILKIARDSEGYESDESPSKRRNVETSSRGFVMYVPT